jgi:organic hydroperoxide reductase OsmC/OhrA
MSEAHQHEARVSWRRRDDRFVDRRYHRAHTWHFDGGLDVPASSSPSSVRPPFSDEHAVDPEEALVAATSSCHMLVFLFEAAKAGFSVDSYDDSAVGLMGKNARGRAAIVRIVLRPRISWSGDTRPAADQIAALHHRAHEGCFIASSLSGEVVVEDPEPG